MIKIRLRRSVVVITSVLAVFNLYAYLSFSKPYLATNDLNNFINPSSEFVRCRLKSNDHLNNFLKHGEIQNDDFPLPVSAFVSENTLTLVLITETDPRKTGGEVKELPDYLPWILTARWWVELPSTHKVNCSVVNGGRREPFKNRRADWHQWTIVLQCPLHQASNANLTSVSLATAGLLQNEEVRHGIWNHIPVCTHDVPERIKLAACTQVANNHINRLPEWIEYHQLLGIDYFLIYVNEPSINKYEVFLRSYLEEPGLVTLVPFFFDVATQERGLFSQKAAMNDCVYRFRNRADWVALHDADEFLQVMNPDINFLSYLKSSGTLGALSFRSWYFGFEKPAMNSKNCSEIYSRLKSMTWRSRDAVFFERQKLVVRPQNVRYVSVHDVTNGGEVVDVPPDQARLVHYRMPPPDRSQPFMEEQEQGLLMEDYSLAWSKLANKVISNLRKRGFIVKEQCVVSK